MGYKRVQNVICLALGSTWTDCNWKNILFSKCGQGDTRELWDPVGEVDRMGDLLSSTMLVMKERLWIIKKKFNG